MDWENIPNNIENWLGFVYVIERINAKDNEKRYYWGCKQFVKNLKLHEYLEYFESVKDALLFMLERNDIFYTQYYAKRDIEVFNKKEKDLILNGKIFSLKKNNFI